ncbi:response regulator transcription factor [Pseudobacteroides cellulosolvens]|uniref:Stage 0 sporulation protein A homolog n=1 Tax=Pseudobacteroides cellulosolvens ATCC 35603 = DSM 2933 TaxID=398512 RepID=A0A0L6JUT8_9FIRM|nr:response regulator transcription factor [Pseudobacteroides cellulosolvens]KNY29588.1 two component transcriptional regulator, winged helix family [Pseudobacteroides cellulosolvens ATCC 35603 = DSM 2933]
MNNKLIYVVDDEQNIRDLICAYLKKESFETRSFQDGESALEAFKSGASDMLIIDIMMPGMDGYSLCRKIRETSDVPIIMVSARDEEIDRILGLELGSDDYISKPFSPRELVARVKTVFRRFKPDQATATEQSPNKIICADLVIFPDERKILTGQSEIELTNKEYELLTFMVMNKNKAFTREQLISSIWGYDYIGDNRAIDDLVKKVRKKLSSKGSNLEITTVWGYGYKICG